MQFKISKKVSRLFTFLLLVIFFLVFISHGGKFLVREVIPKNPVPSIILMGSIPDRALAAIDLYNKALIKKVYIVEENMLGLLELRKRGFMVHTNSEQMKSLLVQAGFNESDITIIPGLARSTKMEADAFTKYLSSHPIPRPDTVLLITSASHTRRAAMIFQYSLNRNSSHKIFVATYPSPYSGYDMNGWFRSKEDIQTTLSEYFKITSFLLIEKWH